MARPEDAAAVRVEDAGAVRVEDAAAVRVEDAAAVRVEDAGALVSEMRRPRVSKMRLGVLPRLALMGIVGAAACWVVGLIWFVNATRRPAEPPPPHTDGIVALTGGAGRVELALHLLAIGRADRLLLSGIGGGTELATLGRIAGIDTAPLAPHITIGRYAASTRGNGVETAAWAEQNRIESLIVVTAGYHMPRALAELRQALPNVHLYPLAVGMGGDHGGAQKGPSLKMEAAEYTKYLLTASGLSAWFPHREPETSPSVAASAGG
jgi:uncharacterized SAM-binding protein YcdF (DUF218 family)